MLNEIGLDLFASERFQVLQSVALVEVVQTTPAQLGLLDGGVFGQLVQAAGERGLNLCALEVGPHLRLALPDQDEGAVSHRQTQNTAPPGSLTVLSVSISAEEDDYRGFYLRRIEGALWLRGFKSWSGHVWQPQDALIFTSARNAAPR
jgi:hypothetical protein